MKKLVINKVWEFDYYRDIIQDIHYILKKFSPEKISYDVLKEDYKKNKKCDTAKTIENVVSNFEKDTMNTIESIDCLNKLFNEKVHMSKEITLLEFRTILRTFTPIYDTSCILHYGKSDCFERVNHHF